MLSILALLAAVLAGSRAGAQTYIAASDFSLTNNPNGTWSYGEEVTLGGAFTLFTVQLDLSPVSDPNSVEGWGASGGFPFLVLNTTANPITAGTTIYPAATVALHPDNGGKFSVLRWTAPSSGQFTVTANFADIANDDPATVGVHVLRNGISLFSDDLDATTLTLGYTGTALSLTMGDTIDFLVGNGGNGYINDHTALIATITAVPEPSTTALLLVGGACLLARRMRGLRKV